jgi:hypothetical protein
MIVIHLSVFSPAFNAILREPRDPLIANRMQTLLESARPPHGHSTRRLIFPATVIGIASAVALIAGAGAAIWQYSGSPARAALYNRPTAETAHSGGIPGGPASISAASWTGSSEPTLCRSLHRAKQSLCQR